MTPPTQPRDRRRLIAAGRLLARILAAVGLVACCYMVGLTSSRSELAGVALFVVLGVGLGIVVLTPGRRRKR
ncbi:MAG: hypothetical protein LBG60_09515 [Bifidobacteriaceae bacterium]|nr:hypothetical protein [Bifidobacteriaceae bacterium]